MKLGVARSHSGGSQRENGDRWVPFSINLRFNHLHGSVEWSERKQPNNVAHSKLEGQFAGCPQIDVDFLA